MWTNSCGRQAGRQAGIAAVVAADGRIRFTNLAFARLVGTDLQGVYDSPVERWIVHESRPGRDGLSEARVQTDGGEQLSLRSAHVFLQAPGGTCHVVILFPPDVEGALITRAVMLEQVIGLGTMAASVVHEISNPLTYVLGELEAAQRDVSSPTHDAWGAPLGNACRIQDRLAQARKGVERIVSILSDLREMNPGRTAGAPLFRRVDLRTVVATAVRIAEVETRTKTQIVCNLPALPLVLADGPRLVQVFLNLILNAAQAQSARGSHGSEIRIAARSDHAVVEVNVRDNGVGIERSVLPLIFDPFYTTRSQEGGTGLGLFLARRTVRAHDGELLVSSQPGVGTAITVRLPVHPLRRNQE